LWEPGSKEVTENDAPGSSARETGASLFEDES